MDNAFDPYHVWLGIPPSEQPPNHYRLLALALFEASPEVIENAAERQMAHIRRAAHGKRAEDSQRLLNEIAAAQRALLDLGRKAQYDARLRAKLGAAAHGYEQTIEWQPERAVRPPAPPPPRPAVAAAAPPAKWKKSPDQPPPDAAPAAAELAAASPAPIVAASASVRARARRRFPTALVLVLAIAALLPVLALVAALAMTSSQPAIATGEDTAARESPPDAAPLPRVGEVPPPSEGDAGHPRPVANDLPKPSAASPSAAKVENDPRDPFDNSPSFGRTAGEPKIEQTVTVSARTLLPRLAFFSLPAEARTRVELKAGQIVKLKIDGAWRIGPGGDQVRDASALYIAVGHPGQPATQFAQGARQVEFNVQKDGWLFMGIEDLLNFDNAGEMTVQVSVY